MTSDLNFFASQRHYRKGDCFCCPGIYITAWKINIHLPLLEWSSILVFLLLCSALFGLHDARGTEKGRMSRGNSFQPTGRWIITTSYSCTSLPRRSDRNMCLIHQKSLSPTSPMPNPSWIRRRLYHAISLTLSCQELLHLLLAKSISWIKEKLWKAQTESQCS
jgi:hypothetical protein